MGSVVEVKGLTKSYGDIRAVDSLDLDIAEGEIFGFLGPMEREKQQLSNR